MQIELGLAIAIGGFVLGFFTFHRNREKDVKKEASSDAVIGEKLNHIGSGVDSIRVDLKVSERRITEISEQLIRTDESAKSAHKRIDGMEKECQK